MLFSASPFPLTLSLLSACLVSALTIPGPDGDLNALEPFEPGLNHNLSGIDPKAYQIPGTQVWVGIEERGRPLAVDPVLDLIDRAYQDLAGKPPGSTLNQDDVSAYTAQQFGYYFRVYRIFPPQAVEWEWIADTLTGLRTIMTLPAAQGGIGVRSIEFLGGQPAYPFFLWRGWIGVGRPPRPPPYETGQNGTVATT